MNLDNFALDAGLENVDITSQGDVLVLYYSMGVVGEISFNDNILVIAIWRFILGVVSLVV